MAKQQTPYRMTALAGIKPYERNPRIIPQAAVDAVARSIHAFGFRQPIVVDRNGVILAGHTRYKAARAIVPGDNLRHKRKRGRDGELFV